MQRLTGLITAGIVGLGLLLIGMSVNPAARAQGNLTPTPRPVTNDEVNQVSRNLYCPVCKNIPLDVCETPACERWRAEVRAQLAQGKTEAEIRDYFIGFGTNTVGMPTDPIWQFLTVGLPFMLIGLIGLVVVVTLVRWQGRKQEPVSIISPPETTPAADDYRARLEQELKEREK